MRMRYHLGMRRWISIGLGAALVLGVLVGCGRSEERRPGPVRIVVSIPPLEGLVREVAPEGAEIVTLVRPGQSAHGFELRPSDAKALAEADVVVYVGLGLERRLEDYLARHPSGTRSLIGFARICESTRDVESAHAHGHDEHGHDDHEHGDHEHGGVDPHLWVDPALVEEFVPVLAARIDDAARRVGQEPRPVTAVESLVERIRAFDAECRERLAPFAGRAIVTHHAAFERFADRYGLKVATVLRPVSTREPTPGEMAQALEAIAASGADAIFIEPQFNADAARKIAERAGVRLGVLDPLGDGDWFETMRGNLEEMVRVLGESQ